MTISYAFGDDYSCEKYYFEIEDSDRIRNAIAEIYCEQNQLSKTNAKIISDFINYTETQDQLEEFFEDDLKEYFESEAYDEFVNGVDLVKFENEEYDYSRRH